MSTWSLVITLVVLGILAGLLFFGREEVPTPGVHTMPMEDGRHVMPDGEMMHY